MLSTRSMFATKRPHHFLTTSVGCAVQSSPIPPQKRACTIVRPKICIHCFNGEASHITHLLMDMPVAPLDG